MSSSSGDSWLNITAQDLEQMLQERSSGQVHVSGQNSSQQMRSQVRRVSDEKEEEKEDEQEKDSSYSLVAVSQGMKNFLSAMSSHEGAEMPW